MFEIKEEKQLCVNNAMDNCFYSSYENLLLTVGLYYCKRLSYMRDKIFQYKTEKIFYFIINVSVNYHTNILQEQATTNRIARVRR